MDFKPHVKIIKRETSNILNEKNEKIAEIEVVSGKVTRIDFVKESGHIAGFTWMNYADAGYRLQVNGDKELSLEQVKILRAFLGEVED